MNKECKPIIHYEPRPFTFTISNFMLPREMINDFSNNIKKFGRGEINVEDFIKYCGKFIQKGID